MGNEISRRRFFRYTGATALACGAMGATDLLVQFPKAASAAAPAVKAHAFKCGVLKTQTQYMLKDTRVGTPMDIPVTFFVISHGKDWLAFDTGNNAMVAKDPVGYWSEPVTKAYYPVMKDYEEFQAQVQKLGLKPKDFKAVVLSHGHLDHAGAIDNFKGTDVPIYVQEKELEIIKKAVASGERTAYIPADFAAMDKLNVKTVNGVFDVFGDQTVIAFPTPGHTDGHQSLLVKQTDGKALILASDAMYTIENMRDAIPPGLAMSMPVATQGLYVFTIMSHIGAEVVPSHDPDYWAKKSLAPKNFDA
jgi:N-acyl homoserine lactone hydrolase